MGEYLQRPPQEYISIPAPAEKYSDPDILAETAERWSKHFRTLSEIEAPDHHYGLLAQTISSDPFLDALGRHIAISWHQAPQTALQESGQFAQHTGTIFDSHGHIANGGPFVRQGFIYQEFEEIPLQPYFDTADQRGVDVIAVTNHDTLARASEMADMAKSIGKTTLTGVEHTTLRDGRWVHIISLGIDPHNVERNKKGLYKLPTFETVGDTIRWIHERQGVAIGAHISWKGSINRLNAKEVIKYGHPEKKNRLEGVEIAYPVILKKSDKKKQYGEIAALVLLAQALQLSILGSSDYHNPADVGLVATETCEPAPYQPDILEHIRRGSVRPVVKGNIFTAKKHKMKLRDGALV